MSGRIIKLNASTHQVVQKLLPWFVLDKLDSDELAMVQEHVQGCTHCQADVEFQKKLTAVRLPDESGADVESAFAKLLPQLKPQTRNPRLGGLLDYMRNWRRDGNRSWMHWALGAQFAAISGLCIMLLQPQPEIPVLYRGLGGAGSVDGKIVVRFKPQTTEQELRRILHASGARVVDGPTVTDIYLLDIGSLPQARALGLLRAESAVVLAESLDRSGVP